MYKIILVYIIFINSIGIWSMYSDKKRSTRRQYRIPEKRLFQIALLGGSLGSLLGMQLVRHKTKHWYFKYGIPAILMIQVAVGCWIYYRINY